jgi:hypothetical protein
VRLLLAVRVAWDRRDPAIRKATKGRHDLISAERCGRLPPPPLPVAGLALLVVRVSGGHSGLDLTLAPLG